MHLYKYTCSTGVLVIVTALSPSPKTRTTFAGVLRWAGCSFSCSALIDSVVEVNFIDETWALKHGIPLCDLKDPPIVFASNGRVLSKIHRATFPVSLTVSSNHQETITFFNLSFRVTLR